MNHKAKMRRVSDFAQETRQGGSTVGHGFKCFHIVFVPFRAARGGGEGVLKVLYLIKMLNLD